MFFFHYTDNIEKITPQAFRLLKKCILKLIQITKIVQNMKLPAYIFNICIINTRQVFYYIIA